MTGSVSSRSQITYHKKIFQSILNENQISVLPVSDRRFNGWRGRASVRGRIHRVSNENAEEQKTILLAYLPDRKERVSNIVFFIF